MFRYAGIKPFFFLLLLSLLLLLSGAHTIWSDTVFIDAFGTTFSINYVFQNFCVYYVLGFLSKKMIGNNNGCGHNGFHGENGHSGKRNITVSKHCGHMN